MQNYHLIDLHAHWPFPKILNPLYSEVAPDSLKWINSYRIFTPKQQEKFGRIEAGLLGALAYPVHNRKNLRLGCDLLNVLYAADEVSDLLDGAEAEQLAAKIFESLKNPAPPNPLNKHEHPLVRLHQDFFKAVVDGSSENFSRRFFKNYEDFLRAMVREAKDRETRTIRTTIEEYLDLRRYTGAFIPCFDMMLLPLDIPDEVLADPRIKELEMMAIDMVAVANDVVSFNVEQARGDIHNVVIVLIRGQNLSVQQAMNRIGEWYHQRARDFVKAMSDLPKVESKKVRVDIQKYVWALGNGVTANYEWSFESERFWNGMTLDEEMKNGHDFMIELMPQQAIMSSG